MGKKIKVYKHQKNLIQDVLGFTNQVYKWTLILQEYSLKIIHVKGIHNIVANAISRLNYDPTIEDMANWVIFTKCCFHYPVHIESVENTYNHQEQINLVLTNYYDEVVIYPLTVSKITLAQKHDASLKKLKTH